MLKAAKEQQVLENDKMTNGDKAKGLFRKSKKPSQAVLMTRGISPYTSFSYIRHRGLCLCFPQHQKRRMSLKLSASLQ